MRVYLKLPIIMLLAISSHATGAVFYLDHFSVTRNGAVIFADAFDAGGPPPQAPNFISNGNPASYLVNGTMGPESGGKLMLEPSAGGVLLPNLAGNPDNLVQKATLQTNIDPNNLAAGLKQGGAFSVRAVYDLVVPDLAIREGYGIRFEDFGGQANGNDVYELAVRRLTNDAIAVSFRELDFLNDTITNITDYVLSAQELLSQQIMLELGTVGATQAVQAAVAFGSGNVFGASTTLTGTGSLFNGENFTRAVFIARTAPAQIPLPSTLGLLLAGVCAWRLSRRRPTPGMH